MMLLEKVKKHGRIKEKYNPNPNAAQKRYWDFVAKMGCLVCGASPSIHHVISDGFKRLTKNHWHVTPLCHKHHQGDKGYHGLGSDGAFQRMYGINLHKSAIDILAMFKTKDKK